MGTHETRTGGQCAAPQGHLGRLLSRGFRHIPLLGLTGRSRSPEPALRPAGARGDPGKSKVTPELVQIQTSSILPRSVPVIPDQKRAEPNSSYDNRPVGSMSSRANAPHPRPGVGPSGRVCPMGCDAHRVVTCVPKSERTKTCHHCKEPVKNSELTAYFRVGCLCRVSRQHHVVSHEVMKHPTASVRAGVTGARFRPFPAGRATFAPGLLAGSRTVRIPQSPDEPSASNVAPAGARPNRRSWMAFPARGRHHALS